MKPGNVLIFKDEKFGHHRYWEVVGIYLGSVNEESLIELRSIGSKPGHDGDTLRSTTFVPECLTRNLIVAESIIACTQTETLLSTQAVNRNLLEQIRVLKANAGKVRQDALEEAAQVIVSGFKRGGWREFGKHDAVNAIRALGAQPSQAEGEKP